MQILDILHGINHQPAVPDHIIQDTLKIHSESIPAAGG